MSHVILDRLENDLCATFAKVRAWSNVDSNLLEYVPRDNGWTIRQILEHISLTNHYLLILIRKGTNKAIEKAKKADHVDWPADYDLNWNKLTAIGEHKSFAWSRPQHMEPTGVVAMNEIILTLHEQLQECIGYLHQMANGEGVLYKTMMSVNNIGKNDVYHYISFLAQHAQRHITQMKKISEEFKTKKL